MDERNFARQHFIEPKTDDRVGLATANFHDVPRPCRGLANGIGQAANRIGIAVFVEEFHEGFGVRDCRNVVNVLWCGRLACLECAGGTPAPQR